MLVRLFGALMIALPILFWGSSQVSAQGAQCNTLKSRSCGARDDCTWVSSYKTKKGASVSAYCRSKGKKAGKSTKKKSTSKTTSNFNKKTTTKKSTAKKTTTKKTAAKKSTAKKSTKKTTAKKKSTAKKKTAAAKKTSTSKAKK